MTAPTPPPALYDQAREAPTDVVRLICERMEPSLWGTFPDCWCCTPPTAAKDVLNALIRLGWRPPKKEER